MPSDAPAVHTIHIRTEEACQYYTRCVTFVAEWEIGWTLTCFGTIAGALSSGRN